MKPRIEAIQEAISKHASLDAFLITKPENIYYVSHFPGDNALLLVTLRRCYFITDRRYSEAAERFFDHRPGFKVLIAGQGINKIALCNSIIKKFKYRKIGFEARSVSFSSACELFDRLGKTKLEPINAFVERFRVLKTAHEITLIKKAIAINEKTYRYLRRVLKVGSFELDIRHALETHMRKIGADEHSFPTIIASGKKSAVPHAYSDRTRIAANKILLVDMGTRYKQYCSDLTRTFHVGQITRFYHDTYAHVLNAQQMAINAIRPGVMIKDVVHLVHDYFKREGLLQYFSHSLGHGVGLEIHEGPLLWDKSEDVFQEGMVVTVEPGLYFAGRGGIRIEDMVLVTKRGARVLSSYPKTIESMIMHN
ncbi:MAG: aminopeptidase P family protein [Candidatus Omnitrophica bacterium]|nr:aminopeptidase P family protein [Candidatus Omnitrophota bacterium]